MTTNLFFPKICEIKLKINYWGHDEDETIRKISGSMIEKYDKYSSEIHGLMVVVVILDLRLKMTMLHACYIALFGEEEAGKYVTKAHEFLTGLIKHYYVKDQDVVATSSGGASSTFSAVYVWSSHQANLKTYMDCLIWSPDQLIMIFGRFSALYLEKPTRLVFTGHIGSKMVLTCFAWVFDPAWDKTTPSL